MTTEIDVEDWLFWKRKRSIDKDIYCAEKACRSVKYCVESRTDLCCQACYYRELAERELAENDRTVQ